MVPPSANSAGTQTRKREGRTRRKGDGSFGGRQSSSRECRIWTKAPRSVRASVRAVAEKLLAMEGISGRRSARLSRGPRGTDLGGLRVLASIVQAIRQASARRRRQGCQRWSIGRTRGRIKAARIASNGHRSEGRVVKRGLPRSHLHRAAPSFSVPVLPSSDCAFGRCLWMGARHAARRRASEHEAQASEREHPRVSPKGTRV